MLPQRVELGQDYLEFMVDLVPRICTLRWTHVAFSDELAHKGSLRLVGSLDLPHI